MHNGLRLRSGLDEAGFDQLVQYNALFVFKASLRNLSAYETSYSDFCIKCVPFSLDFPGLFKLKTYFHVDDNKWEHLIVPSGN